MPAPQLWEPEEIDQPDELELEPWISEALTKSDASTPAFALGKVPVQACGMTNDDTMCYKAKPVDVQITGMVWDLNFHMKAGKAAEYDISVAFIRRGDRNALGEIIHTFKPSQTVPNVLTAYAKMTRRGRDSQRRIKSGSLVKNTNFCSLKPGDLVLLHTREAPQKIERDRRLHTSLCLFPSRRERTMGTPTDSTPQLAGIPEEAERGKTYGEWPENCWAWLPTDIRSRPVEQGADPEALGEHFARICGEQFLRMDAQLVNIKVEENGVMELECDDMDMPDLEEIEAAQRDDGLQEGTDGDMTHIAMNSQDGMQKTVKRVRELRMQATKRPWCEDPCVMPPSVSWEVSAPLIEIILVC
ncbi:hypothetical protein OH76DRAFT_1423874 [Lentinus brumalis]|uniref:Uncharacterized protein n=1 Tax=Lentinus brumalis TaxID=2498619 RepID=A0A371CIR8_9APHY|nr:hypothetical protein OH76DRAFT_1423874 [Polyporus brumalis]